MRFHPSFEGRRLLFFALIPLFWVACSNAEPAVESTPELVPSVSTKDPVPSATPLPEEENFIEETPTTPPTVTPLPIAEPTQTTSPTETVEPTAEPEPTSVPISINSMPSEQFIIMSDEVRQNIDGIFANGKNMGRDPGIFAILGDSLIATSQSLAKWDSDDYVLGDYEYLQPTIDYYAGSFSRYGVSVRVGLHSWSVFDPLWADKEFCLANEDLLACELRLNNPSVVIIFLGSNDAGSPGGFDFNYRQIVETLIAQGVVPVLATKADRFEGPDNVNNEIIRQIAVDFQVPLLEFDILADTLPGRGLSSDNVHLTYREPLDYTVPEMLTLGYPVHNLATLMILDEVRKEITDS